MLVVDVPHTPSRAMPHILPLDCFPAPVSVPLPPGCRLFLSLSHPSLHPASSTLDLKYPPSDPSLGPAPCSLSWVCISPHGPFPLSWAWTPPTAQFPSSSQHHHSGCRHCWRICWMPRKFCRMWTSSQLWPCCCPRAPALAVLQGPRPAVLEGQPMALRLRWARAPTPQWRRVPHPPRLQPPPMHCRDSAPPLCSSGLACSPSCVATTGRWARGKGTGTDRSRA